MRVAIYCRVSTEDQKERETIVTQREFGLRYSDVRGYDVHAVYEDDGVSATKYPSLTQREAGSRLLSDARAGLFEAVLVYKLDRLGRGARNVLGALEELERFVFVQSMTESFDSSTPSGRFMRTIMAGAGEYERDTFIERSTEATNRLAYNGQWMGGIVPFGYRVIGSKREARLTVSEDLIDGMALSEADVIRLIYHMSGVEGRSCAHIADHLNALGVPPAYTRDGRGVVRGKRKETTQGIWRYGRICNMIKNPTYKGTHFYGRRSAKKREIIERAVPAIVSEELWEKAQETLRQNFLFNARSAKRQYLLRGQMKCVHCGLTYIGTASQVVVKQEISGLKIGEKKAKVYYKCNGKHNGRSLYGDAYRSCPSKPVSGDIEEVIMADIMEFLRNPGDVLSELQDILAEHRQQPQDLQSKLVKAQTLLREKHQERDRVLALFRRGRIDDATLDRQLDDIAREEEGVRKQVEVLSQEVQAAQDGIARFESLEPLLLELRRRLEEPLTWEIKRQLVETLVESIRVETHGEGRERYAKVVVVYCFEAPVKEREVAVYPTFSPTEDFTDVPAATCLAEAKVSAAGAARARTSPAPAPHRKYGATSRAFLGRWWTVSTFTSRCPGSPARS